MAATDGNLSWTRGPVFKGVRNVKLFAFSSSPMLSDRIVVSGSFSMRCMYGCTSAAIVNTNRNSSLWDNYIPFWRNSSVADPPSRTMKTRGGWVSGSLKTSTGTGWVSVLGDSDPSSSAFSASSPAFSSNRCWGSGGSWTSDTWITHQNSDHRELLKHR